MLQLGVGDSVWTGDGGNVGDISEKFTRGERRGEKTRFYESCPSTITSVNNN